MLDLLTLFLVFCLLFFIIILTNFSTEVINKLSFINNFIYLKKQKDGYKKKPPDKLPKL